MTTHTTATFPPALLGYLEVAVTRPLGPGAVAHRATYHRVTVGLPGRSHGEYLTGAACEPTTTRTSPIPDREGNPVEEKAPSMVHASMSAAWAQAHGAARCTRAECYPPQPGE